MHAGEESTQTCSVCKKPGCARCITYEIDDAPACATCANDEAERSRSMGSALLAFVGVGYLATLAIGYVVFHARPFVGGIAAVVAIALGRALQLLVKPRNVRPRRASL